MPAATSPVTRSPKRTRRADREIRTSQRLRRLLIGVALLLVVALVAGVVAVWQRNRADDSAAAAQGAERAAEAERDQARIDRLVAESERELDSHLDLALLLAAEARRRDDTIETRGALLTALTHNLTSERLRPGASPSTGGMIQHTNSSFLGFLAGPRRLQYEADISADGRIVASVGRDTANTGGLTLVYDTTSRAEVGRIESDQPIWGVDVSPDGAFVLARDDESLYLFDTVQQTTTRLAVEVPAGDVFINALIQPGTTRVLSFTDQGTSQLWDWESEAPVATTLPPAQVTKAAFLPDGSLVVDQPDAAILVWDVDAGRAQRAVDLEAPPSAIGATAITADGARLVGVEPAGRTYVWDLGTGRLVGEPATRPGTGRAIAASPTDASTIAIGSGGGGISLYDLDSEQVIGDRLYGHGSGIRDLTYSADGRYLVSVADDGLIGLWGDNDAAGLIAQPVAPDAHNIAYSADGRHALVRNSFTSRYEVRDAETLDEPGVVIQAPAGAPDRIGFGQLSADGSTVLAVTDEQPAGRLFASDAETGRPIWTLADADFVPGPPNVSPDGRVAVAVDFDFLRLRAWDITTGRRIGDVTIADVPDVPDGEAFAGVPQFSPDGKHLDVPANLGVVRFRVDDLEPVAYVSVPGPFVVSQIESVPESDDVIAVGNGRRARPSRHGDVEGGRGRSLGRPVDARVGRREPRRFARCRVPRVLVPARVVRRAHAPARRQAVPRRRLHLRPDVHERQPIPRGQRALLRAQPLGHRSRRSGKTRRARRRAATSRPPSGTRSSAPTCPTRRRAPAGRAPMTRDRRSDPDAATALQPRCIRFATGLPHRDGIEANHEPSGRQS